MKTCLIVALVFIAPFTTHAQPTATNLSLPTVNDPALSDYLTRLTNHVIARTNTNITCSVQVLDDESLNAFTQPNGELYLTRGLLNAVANEAELVFVLAQQLSSLNVPTSYQRPELKKPSAGHTLLIGLISGAVIVMGGPAGVKVGALIMAQEINHHAHPRPVYASLQTVPPTLIFDADRLAVDYLHKAGYDPDAALSVLEKLRSLRPRNYVKQSLLPAPSVTFLERLRRVRHHLAKLERKNEYLLNASAFPAMKKRLAVNSLRTTTASSP